MAGSKASEYPDSHQDSYSKTLFGFWLYLMTDFVLFGSLFTVYAVLRSNTFGGPSAGDLFSRPYSLWMTLVLMAAGFISGVAGAYAHRNKKKKSLFYFLVTAALGILFFIMQTSEFVEIIRAGHSWRESAFLSAYFSLTGTFWAHMIFAILFTFIIGFFVWREDQDITIRGLARLTCLRYFWQFLYIVWGFIFTIVYLLGVD